MGYLPKYSDTPVRTPRFLFVTSSWFLISFRKVIKFFNQKVVFNKNFRQRKRNDGGKNKIGMERAEESEMNPDWNLVFCPRLILEGVRSSSSFSSVMTAAIHRWLTYRTDTTLKIFGVPNVIVNKISRERNKVQKSIARW